MTPRPPLLVLAAAIVLPGSGQVLNRTPVRGLIFVFYIVLLGAVTYQLTTPDHSLIGRYAGGLFVYAISIMDAYRAAAVRAAGARVDRSPR